MGTLTIRLDDKLERELDLSVRQFWRKLAGLDEPDTEK